MTSRVSSSGRTWGRPRQRRSFGVSISAMLLHDACHSIDSPNVGRILENIKFPNYPFSRTPEELSMSHHSTSFEIERPVPDNFTAQPDKPNVSTGEQAAGAPA